MMNRASEPCCTPLHEPPIACNLAALTTSERAEHAELLRRVASAHELTEIEDGFRLGYRIDPDLASAIARWMVYERRCCPFLAFELTLEDDAKFSLRLRCPPDAKDLVRAVLRDFAEGPQHA
jgi:hypothetical protein